MKRDRIKLEVEVDLDPIEGTFHTKESAEEVVGKILMEMIPHYKPTVTLVDGTKSDRVWANAEADEQRRNGI